MDLGIEGKRAAVAAGSAGLGLGAARALVAAGAKVVICGRDTARLEAAVDRLGPGASSMVADVGNAAGATAFVEGASERLGGLDILVTNAGGPPPGNFADTPVEAYLPALELNLVSTVAMCKAAVPAMQQQGWGRVVAITSITVRQPNEYLMLSNTARAGATGFLKTLALEVASDGVTVNSVQPGYHATGRLAELPVEDSDAIIAGIPAGRMGEADDLGQLVAFLCSASANFITGAAIPVDGGAYRGLQ
jgi:3-oxoacyl-[acyl-carrier protein] reductase